MGGTNPYIEKTEIEKPTKPYAMTFITPDRKTVEIKVDPEKVPYGPTGQPGSILDIALSHDVDIEHACGGVVACSTCHVIVKKGLDSCNEGTDDEFDQLEEAPGITLQSRLGCQCVPSGASDIVVEVPALNKNLVKESH